MSLDRGGTGSSQGASGNQRGGSGEGMGGGKGGGRNDSKNSKSTTKSSPPTTATQAPAAPAKVAQAPAAPAKATATPAAPAKSVSDRLPSVSKALSSYGKSPAASAPAYARAGYGDTINAQRNQLAGPVSGGGPSSLGGASMYGMDQKQYDKTINTDNLNGVIGNLQGKATRGTLSENDISDIAAATGDYNNLRGAGILGRTLAGTPGKWGAQQLAQGVMAAPGDYLSGMARKAATGELDDGRLIGQRDHLGDGGMGDSALQLALSLAGMALPGAGMLSSGISAGLTTGAPGFGGVLNDLNAQAGNAAAQGHEGNGNNKGYAAPARPSQVTPTSAANGTLNFDSNDYNPSRYNVSAGRRGY